MDSIRQCVLQLARLPGVGEKTAQRLTWWLLQAPPEVSQEIAQALLQLKGQVQECQICHIYGDENPCSICTRLDRDPSTICVVERPQDIENFERSGEYHGLYHVLHGSLSPLRGIMPEDLRIRQLIARAQDTEEIILATDPDTEGDATAMYISRLLQPMGVRVTRLAHGISVGTEIEYVDQVSLVRALKNRMEMQT